MSLVEFELLPNYYEVEWNNYMAHFTGGPVRSCPQSRRKDGNLAYTLDQSLFILHYLKSYALQEHHAAVYEMSQLQKVSLINACMFKKLS